MISSITKSLNENIWKNIAMFEIDTHNYCNRACTFL